jgi:hypothetical protein
MRSPQLTRSPQLVKRLRLARRLIPKPLRRKKLLEVKNSFVGSGV